MRRLAELPPKVGRIYDRVCIPRGVFVQFNNLVAFHAGDINSYLCARHESTGRIRGTHIFF